ncbi:hypothetical protein [Microbulbifer halophilus]
MRCAVADNCSMRFLHDRWAAPRILGGLAPTGQWAENDREWQ